MQSQDPRFAQQNPRVVRICTLRTYTWTLTSVVFLNDVDNLSFTQVDLMRVLSVVVGEDAILFQALHLVRVGDDSLCGCRWEGEE